MTDRELRKEMIKGIIDEMRGPRFGVNEVVSYNPGSEYLVGAVIPMDWKPPVKGKKTMDNLDSENIIDSDLTGADDSNLTIDNILGNNSPILNPNSQIRSFGISFLVNSQKAIKLDICVTWARYFEDSESDEAFGLNGTLIEREDDSTFWKRESYGEVLTVKVDESYGKDPFPVYESEDGAINLFIKRQDISSDKSHISVYLINNLEISSNKSKYHPPVPDCIFQPSIRINFDDSKKLIGMDTIVGADDEIDFLYLNKPVLATGHLCSVIWKDIEYYDEFQDYENLIWPDESSISNHTDFTKPAIRSEFLPLYPINLPNFNVPIDDFELKANKLAYLSQDELYDNFIKLYDSYSEWIVKNELKGKECSSEYQGIIENIVNKEKYMLNRIKEGIELIKSEKLVYLAFCFANKTIHLQDAWKKGINTNKNSDITQECDEKSFEWRPFQLTFLLISLESIWNENSKNKDVLDLLWIPTGGGKTEAYLAIMAFTMSLRRLKSKFGLTDEKTGAGVSIISRYTLRLLTVQQFRRTLRMITAAEFLRVYKSFGKYGWRNSKDCTEDWLYGSVRFSVGMWVGGSVTPLYLNKKDNNAIDILKSHGIDEGYGDPAQIMKCPVCGAWIAIPDGGINEVESNVHIVVKTNESRKDVETKLKQAKIEDETFVESVKVTDETNSSNHITISLFFNDYVDQKQFDDIVRFIYENYEMVSLNKSLPGYIKSQGQIGSRQQRFETDYEIWCTNPNCSLNHEWMEGAPVSDSKFEFPDGNYLRTIENPFKINSKIPIPAYLIDEHVYNRCPTVIVSTADKIARFAFEPKAGSILGVVNKYNKYFGYYRNELFPENFPKAGEKSCVSINSLAPPDLIIQDELHLLNGPLGSLFGLYENMVNAIIKKQGGNPKYIASTATINNAEKQVNLLFSKNLVQFPPYGLDISNSYFVHDIVKIDESDNKIIWDENNKGRIYMGLYASGFGHFTHQIRLYSRLLKIGNDNFGEDKYKYYWTLVGYYNAIKELGSGVALYKDDILSRLKNISLKEDTRTMRPEDDNMELSSRIDSTDLPLILDKLEHDGNNTPPEYNAIFTTSMFGTGVDISHLSTMVMNAQPKTTGDYIQATGRIGRNHGGLIIDLLRSGRPRDLNHYELFPSYHSRMNREVEPISVSPFSEGCLSRGLGPSLVSFLRNTSNLECNLDYDATNILLDGADELIEFFKECTIDRLRDMDLNEDIPNIIGKIDGSVEYWKELARVACDGGTNLVYEEKFSTFNRGFSKNVVLSNPAHEKYVVVDSSTNEQYKLKFVCKNAPTSLRDIEDTVEFWV